MLVIVSIIRFDSIEISNGLCSAARASTVAVAGSLSLQPGSQPLSLSLSLLRTKGFLVYESALLSDALLPARAGLHISRRCHHKIRHAILSPPRSISHSYRTSGTVEGLERRI